MIKRDIAIVEKEISFAIVKRFNPIVDFEEEDKAYKESFSLSFHISKNGEEVVAWVAFGCNSFSSKSDIEKYYNAKARGNKRWRSSSSNVKRPYVEEIIKEAGKFFVSHKIKW